MPVSAGRRCRSWVKASSPPADAPTPTTGKPTPRLAGSATTVSTGLVICRLGIFGLALVALGLVLALDFRDKACLGGLRDAALFLDGFLGMDPILARRRYRKIVHLTGTKGYQVVQQRCGCAQR